MDWRRGKEETAKLKRCPEVKAQKNEPLYYNEILKKRTNMQVDCD